jgi:hypothetical protein
MDAGREFLELPGQMFATPVVETDMLVVVRGTGSDKLGSANVSGGEIDIWQPQEVRRNLPPELCACQDSVEEQAFEGEAVFGSPIVYGVELLGIYLPIAFSNVLRRHRQRRRTTPLPNDNPYVVIGEALLHIASDLDPLENEDPEAAAEAPPDQRARLAELVLRKGFFYAQDDYRYAIGRYHEMLCEVAPTMTTDPDFIDLPELFRRATGMKLPTYFTMGIAVMAPFRQVSRDNAHAARAAVSKRQLFSKSNLRQAAPRFFRLIACNKRQFCRELRRWRRTHGSPQYNFVVVERYPLIEMKKHMLCCLSLRFLERKFSSAIYYTLLEALPSQERERYTRFFGRVFERYIQRVCSRTFPGGRFVAGFRYGRDQREAADGWVIYPEAAVIIEAKSARFRLATRISGELGSFDVALRESVLRGAQQLNRVIEDFRRGDFTVAGMDASMLRVLFPVVLTAEHVPMDHFLSRYIEQLIASEGLLRQEGVRTLTILPAKDLERIEGAIAKGVTFADLLHQRLDSAVWRDWPFGNFLYDKFPTGLISEPVLQRIRGIIRQAGYQLFGADVSG